MCRVLLDGFCQDLWPGEYEASTQKMRAFSAGWQRRKQVRRMTQPLSSTRDSLHKRSLCMERAALCLFS